MYQIVKIIGVNPAVLVRLHDALAQDVMVPHVDVPIYHASDTPKGKVRHATLLSSKLDKETGTYVVEIRVEIMSQIARSSLQGIKQVLFTPRAVLDKIYGALGGDMFPPEEKFVDVEK